MKKLRQCLYLLFVEQNIQQSSTFYPNSLFQFSFNGQAVSRSVKHYKKYNIFLGLQIFDTNTWRGQFKSLFHVYQQK